MKREEHPTIFYVCMLLFADDLYSVTGFRYGEILRGPQAEIWRVSLEVFQADGISPREESPLRLEPLGHSNLKGSAQLEGASETRTSALVNRCHGGGEKRPGKSIAL
ncbi:hypothetical protein evm_013719 [Chilo suppressalis]|nr:hypothetical protein evm_013719 [Chilo suppressalis]